MWNLTRTVTTAVLPYVIMQVMLGIQNTKNQMLNTSIGFYQLCTVKQERSLSNVLDPDFGGLC